MKNVPAIRSFVLLLLATTVNGCDRLLDVDLPARVPATSLDDPTRSTLLVQSAISDFECAYGNYVVATGLLVDELLSGSLTNSVVWDRRLIGPNDVSYTAACGQQGVPNGYNLAVYTPLSSARFMADDALRRIESFPDSLVPNKKELLATAAAYAGYAYTLFGEGFCRATFDLGPALQPKEVLSRAEQRFTRTIELADSITPAILNLARVGRARVRLDLGKTADALADARLVPDTFVNATYGSAPARRHNTVWVVNYQAPSATVDPSFRNLAVAGVPDPRVTVVNAGTRAIDAQVPLWQQRKYPTDSSPIRIASWNEAQLIIAEIEGGQSAVNAINALRSRWGLPLFSSSNANEIAKQVLEERRRDLFLDGHRLGDFRRLGLPFPSGLTHKNQTYGTTTCIDLPQFEIDNNPNLRK